MTLTNKLNQLNPITEYRNNPNLNNGLLKAYIQKGIYGYKKALENPSEYETEKVSMKLGSAVDCLLTTPAEFDSNYLIVPSNVSIADKPFQIVSKALDMLDIINKDKFDFKAVLDSTIIPIAREFGYRGNIKDVEKYKNYLIQDCEAYFNLKLSAGKRELLNYEEIMKVNITAAKFKQLNIFTNQNPNIKVYFQKPIYSIYNNMDVKILLDVFVVDTANKKIILYDIKTLEEPVTSFIHSFRRFLYNVQAVFYTEVVKSKFKDYTVVPLSFYAASLNDNLPVQKFTLSPELYNLTLNGSDDKSIYYYKGILEAMNNIQKHIELNEFDLNLDELRFKEKTSTVIDHKMNYVL